MSACFVITNHLLLPLQALSLLLAMILRAMLSARTVDYDSDEDFVVIRRPLLVAQAPAPYLPTTVDTRGARPDLWSSAMRHKVTTVSHFNTIFWIIYTTETGMN
jgi:hypothetical protein